MKSWHNKPRLWTRERKAMSTETRIAEFQADRLKTWATKCNMNDYDIAAMVTDAIKRETAEFRKTLASTREMELQRACDLFDSTMIPALHKAGLMVNNGWSFQVTKGGEIKVGRLGVKLRTTSDVE